MSSRKRKEMDNEPETAQTEEIEPAEAIESKIESSSESPIKKLRTEEEKSTEPIENRKSIVVFDLETTGLNVTSARIVEIGLVKCSNDDNERTTMSMLINPEMPIPDDAIKIHHITNEMVKDARTFRAAAPEIIAFIGDSHIVGHNLLKYDLPLLQNELKRCGIAPLDLTVRHCMDTCDMFRKMEPHTLAKALAFYCEDRKIEHAHRALDDAVATMDVFEAQRKRYGLSDDDFNQKMNHKTASTDKVATTNKDGESNVNIDQFGKFVWGVDGRATFNFGKYKGQSVYEVATTQNGYLKWMSKLDDQNEIVKEIVQKALQGEFLERSKQT